MNMGDFKKRATAKLSAVKAFMAGAMAIGFSAAPLLAVASTTGTVATDDEFYEFFSWLKKNISGGLGVGICLVAVLIGMGISAAKNSPMPVLAGVFLAIMIRWVPAIVEKLIVSGSGMIA